MVKLGVRGFFEEINSVAAAEVDRTAALIDSESLIKSHSNLVAASKWFVASEIKVRESEKEAIAWPDGGREAYGPSARRLNERGLASIHKARKNLRHAIDEANLDANLESVDVVIAFDEARKNLAEVLIKQHVSAQEMKMFLAIYDANRKVLMKDGPTGLFMECERLLDRLVQLREREDRGTGKTANVSYIYHESPEQSETSTSSGGGGGGGGGLPFWKIVFVAAAICLGLWKVYKCFKKKDCETLWDDIAAAGAWLVTMVEKGC